ncbi:membrane-associated protein [Acrasis kona]|uniref:Membrane-associated protein n=1 Tax=Acrasis kona TaxID=1008807 RepID=A0AAW2Z5H8_9EUKA
MSSKEENLKNKRILQELLKSPDNKECADCNAKGPSWASINHGVFLCIRCAGIHRSLGTHISKVRSVTLDVWTDEQVNNMRAGNRVANEMYEAKLRQPKPTESAPASMIDQFCRAKYERMLWKGDTATKQPVPASSITIETRAPTTPPPTKPQVQQKQIEWAPAQPDTVQVIQQAPKRESTSNFTH